MSHRSRRPVGRWLECLTVAVLIAAGQVPGTAEGAADAQPLHAISICILPFYTATSHASLDADLAPLLESDLAREPWVEVIPTKTVYEVCYAVQPPPWFVRGYWERGSGPSDAEVFVGLREHLLPRAWARFPADYYVMGRVISTGTRKNVVVEVTEGRSRRKAVLRSSRKAETPEGVPEALEQIASEIVSFLEPLWSIRNLEEIRKQYLARRCSLESAVRKAQAQADARPELLSLRVLLLSLYEENVETYGAQAAETSARIVEGWDTRDEAVTPLLERLGTDPFLVLCREQAKRGDWSGVEATCRLGMDKNPLRSTEYEKVRLQAQKNGESGRQVKEED